MFPIRTNNRRAISVVMTTMIILVASVVLGTGVVIYGTSLFQTGGQQQSIVSQGLKLWVNATTQTVVTGVTNPVNYAWGAAAIRNNGDVLASVNTIQVRGSSVPFNAWFVDANQTRMSSGTNFQSQFNLTSTDQRGYPLGTVLTGGGITGSSGTCTTFTRGWGPGFSPGGTPNSLALSFQIDQDGASGSNKALCLTQATGPTALNPGDKMIVYFKLPSGVIGPIDSGSAVTVNLYAGNVGGPTTVQVGNP
jgi:hypothetical protein